MTPEERIQKIHDGIVEIIGIAITRLYSLPVHELKVSTPSLEDIIKLCTFFDKVVEGTEIDGQFLESIAVMQEAAEAAERDDEQCLTDCAYHLEDFLDRIR